MPCIFINIMVQKKLLKKEKSIVEIQFNISWDELEPLLNSFFKNLTNINDHSDIKNNDYRAVRFDPIDPKIYDNFFKPVMQKFLLDALRGSDITPIDYPKFEIISYAQGGGLKYKALFTNRPLVTVGDYKEIKLKKPFIEVLNEKDIEEIIDDLYIKWCKKSDILYNHNSFVEHESKFLKSLNFNSLTELRYVIRKNLQELSMYNEKIEIEETILQEVERITNVDLPDVLIEDELNKMLVDLQRKVSDMGLLLDEYLKKQAKTTQSLQEEWRATAEKNLRMELGLAEIARLENITISEIELQDQIDKVKDPQARTNFESKNLRLRLHHALRQAKTLKHLKKIVLY